MSRHPRGEGGWVVITFDRHDEPIHVGDRVVMLERGLEGRIGTVRKIQYWPSDQKRQIRAWVTDSKSGDIENQDFTFASWAKGKQFAKVKGDELQKGGER